MATPIQSTEPSQIVARLLKRVRDFAAGERGAEVVAEIRRELPRFQIKVDLSAESLAYELSEYEQGWAVLLRVCRALPHIFDPDKTATRDLIKHLDQLIGVTGEKKVAIDRIGNSLVPWPQAWPAVFSRTLDECEASCPRTVETVEAAAKVLLIAGGPWALCRFLERLTRLMDDGAAAELRKLIAVVAKLLEVDKKWLDKWHDEIAPEPLDVRIHVLVRVECQDDGSRMLSGWRYHRSRTAGELPAQLQASRAMIQFDDAPRPAEEVPAAIIAALMAGQCLDLALSEPREGSDGALADGYERLPVIELMLPWLELETPAEMWPVRHADGRSEQLGWLVPVVVRPPADPEEPADLRSRRRRHWHDIHNGMGHDDRVLSWPPAGANGLGADPKWLALVVTQRGHHPSKVARAARDAAIPLVIWSSDGTNPRDILNGQALHKLPDLVRDRRCRGRQVSVVWDDPFWVPDRNELRWRSA